MSLASELAQQLDAVAWLAEQVAVEQGARRHTLFVALTQRAAAYAWSDSHVVFPALRAAGWKGVRSDLLTGAARFQQTLASLLVVDPEAQHFADALQVFRQAVAVLAAANREALGPALEQSGIEADALALHEVGRAFELAPRGSASDVSRAARLVQEAALVLAGLRAYNVGAAPPHERRRWSRDERDSR